MTLCYIGKAARKKYAGFVGIIRRASVASGIRALLPDAA